MPVPSSNASTRAAGVRRRPKDRKAQIARVAAQAFNTVGYHAVSMESIAAEVGITAAALYRHYSGKYELFRDSVLALGVQLEECTAAHPDDGAQRPAENFDWQVRALIDTTIANRQWAGLYRWEGRYLTDPDQARLMAHMRAVNRRLHPCVLAVQPGLPSRHKWTLSTAVLSVIGSIADHRAKLPVAQIHSVITELALAVGSADLPPVDTDAVRPPLIRPDVGKYEALLRESMRLFDSFGYPQTSMDDIAAAVGMPTSGIYRYFGGKSELLAAALRRAADGVSAELAAVRSQPGTPHEVLSRLAKAYVARSLANPELANIYYSERMNLTPEDGVMLDNIQRDTVESWVRLLLDVRQDLSAAQARFVVHAAMALVVDLGRLSAHDPATEPQVRYLVERALFGPADSPAYRALRTAAAPR